MPPCFLKLSRSVKLFEAGKDFRGLQCFCKLGQPVSDVSNIQLSALANENRRNVEPNLKNILALFMSRNFYWSFWKPIQDQFSKLIQRLINNDFKISVMCSAPL